MLNKVLNFSAERYFKTAGDLFIYEGDYEAALAMVEKNLELTPQDIRALVLKGDILFCLNRDMEALQVLNQALELNQHCAEALISKAGVLDVLGQHREALHCCEQALPLIDAHKQYLFSTVVDQKLVLLIRLKKYREAQQVLSTAKQYLEPDDYRSLLAAYRPLLDRIRKELREKRHSGSSEAQVTLKLIKS